MIVSCPGCSTHYSYREDDALRIGRCSECDERFALSASKRRYVLLPAGSGVGADPLLAMGVSETREWVDRPAGSDAFPALPDPVEPGGFPALPEASEDEDEGFFGSSLNDDEALFGMDGESPGDAETSDEKVEDVVKDARPAHPVREAMGVFMLAGLGAAAGYHGSLEFGFDPLYAVGVGLAVGLTFGWAWIRWAERKR